LITLFKHLIDISDFVKCVPAEPVHRYVYRIYIELYSIKLDGEVPAYHRAPHFGGDFTRLPENAAMLRKCRLDERL
jgi:hypothetical protein